MTTTDAGARLRVRLADELAAEKTLRSPKWRAALEAVPREVFLGDAVYRFESGEDHPAWTPLRRAEMPEAEWLELAYENRTWVTQVDGVAASCAAAPLSGPPTSSSSLPSLVVGMLEDLDVRSGDRVLEIATGTGYSTALLCHRLGDDRVTSVEVDPDVAEHARTALHRLGHEPVLRVGDGFGGAPEGADYDRIIATCAFRYLPPPWLYQVDASAKILITLAGWAGANAQVLLEVDEEGSAQGRFLPGYRSFMMARAHQAPPHGPIWFPPGAEERPTEVGADVFEDWTGGFVAQLAVPGAITYGIGAERGLLDVATGAHARVRADGDGWTVREAGPARLWRAVEEAVAVWREAGSPHVSAFGMTADPREQRVWRGDPGGPSWRLPV
ncbi:ATP-grasp peptide maturase system methyltransferase [Nocardiopsis composta]|uniref:Protein-L-isoaspartate O-methyltransferase n=1 Tax=Nocardiopsis composta TaxID=157465 RepID=A0A7W8VGP5_9ACTN|nr:ATP-grasp peptide maturase system methyltransferase [Nocardiopsis composta]MBB5435174.1 methyltransferase of ATP-grasp peptide maturase system [Nocardiopsis composta]